MTAKTAGWMTWYGLVVLIIATVFGALDRQILVLLAESLRHSLSLSDTELGLLQGAGFTLFAGVAAVPIGWLADRYGRRTLLSVCVLVWAASTAACGLVHTFPALFLAAAGMGMGEAALVPIVYGLIPEIVPERRRVLANGIYVLAVLLGAGLGAALCGALLKNLESIRLLVPLQLRVLEAWRLAFLFVSAPGPLIAGMILMVRVLTPSGEPRRASPMAPSPPPSPVSAVYMRAHRRTLVGVFGGIGIGQLGFSATAIWIPTIATRSYGASAAQAGQGMGEAYLLSTLVGALLGAVAVPYVKARLGLATPIRVIVTGLLVAAVAAVGLLLARSGSQLYLLFGVQMAAITAGTMLIPTLLQDITPPLLRSRTIAIGSFAMVTLTSLSPVLVGAVSDALRASPHGLVVAVVAVSAIALVTSAVLLQTAQAAVVRTVQGIRLGATSMLREL